MARTRRPHPARGRRPRSTPAPPGPRVGRLLGRLLLLVALVVGAAACQLVPLASSAVGPTTTTTTPCVRVFGAAEIAALDARWPGHHLTASVVDERTGCRYDLHPEHRVTTASVFKVSILGRVLRRAQDEQRDLTAEEHDRLWLMITESYDAPTDAFFFELGGVEAANAFFADHGLTATHAPSDQWGRTVTSAADQAALMRLVAGDVDELLDASHRELARGYLANVVEPQRWGIGAGLPETWSFWNKNGFYPSECCAWRINSAGRVGAPGAGGAYDVAILSDGWATDAEGIQAVEGVAHVVNDALAVDAPGSAPFGVVDLVTPGSRSVRVAGWAIDPDTPAPVTVQVTIDEQPPVVLVADMARGDVASVHPWAGAAHGFDRTLPDVEPGRRVVCIEALDAPVPVAAPARLACHLIIVAS